MRTSEEISDQESGWPAAVTTWSSHEGPSGVQWAYVNAETPSEVRKRYDEFRRQAILSKFDLDALTGDMEKVYSTSQAAAFFGRSNQWMYWGLRHEIFTYKDGRPILPERVGKMGKRRFTLPIIREIALSVFRRGNLSEEELEAIMAKILIEEFGEAAFAESD